MKKNLSKKLTLFYSSNFPRIFRTHTNRKYIVTIGIGGNIGDTKKLFNKLILSINQNKKFDLLMTSPLLLNPPFGYLEQKSFLNGIICLSTNLCVNDFFKITQRLEKRFGRKRSFKDAPRTLDIDIIFFDNKKINTKKLIIPHKDWANRESVTIPLKYIKTNSSFKKELF